MDSFLFLSSCRCLGSFKIYKLAVFLQQKIKVLASAENPELLHFKPGKCYTIALHALPTAKKSAFLVFAYLMRSTSFFQSSHNIKLCVMWMLNQISMCEKIVLQPNLTLTVVDWKNVNNILHLPWHSTTVPRHIAWRYWWILLFAAMPLWSSRAFLRACLLPFSPLLFFLV